MNRRFLTRLFLAATLVQAALTPTSRADVNPAFYSGWTEDYTGTEPNTLLLWKFDNPSPGADASGNGWSAVFAPSGIQTGVEGRFGQTFLSEAPRSTCNSHYARSSSQTPAFNGDALSVEFWFKPVSETPGEGATLSYFMDNRYTEPAGIQVLLVNQGSVANGIRVVVGNGAATATLTSPSQSWEEGKWTHLAVTYKNVGGDGVLRIYRDGTLLAESTTPQFGDLSPSNRFYRLANRLGSSFGTVPGYYDNFRVSDVAYHYMAPPKRFPIGGYAPNPTLDLADGFTVAGPVYSAQRDAVLATSELLGMPYFYRVGVHIDFLGSNGPAPTSLDFTAIAAEIRAQVAAVADSEAITAWYLTPEELRYWRSLEMQYLAVARQAILDADPLQRPIWMYEPNHRAASSLMMTVPYQDIVGKGVYVNYAGRKTERAWVHWTLNEVNLAIASANPAAVPIATLEMFQNPAAEEQALIPAWVRHDSYASLVSGAQGIVIYTFANNRTNLPSYFNSYKGVANELNGPLRLGAVFLEGEDVVDPLFTLSPLNPTTVLTGKSSGPTVDTVVPSFYTRTLDWRGHHYFFAVNSSSSPITVTLGQVAGWEPLLSGQPALSGSAVTLPAWGVTAFRKAVSP